VSEQENKTLTAVEIERELREGDRKIMSRPTKQIKEEDEGRPANSLGIEKLKKSRKGLIIIVAAFVLLAAGVSVYYVPSIIRSMSSNDEKPASSDVATGSVKRQTG
jgi:type IV secretion system protein VirB10